jgi:uncharacterized protein
VVACWATAPAIAADFKIPPAPTSYVTDRAGVLSNATREWVEGDLRTYDRQTGHQVIVYIAQTTGSVPLETFTGEAADLWKIGRKGRDDGVVLFVFMRDRMVRIEVGYGLESALTDADASRIIQGTILPRMRHNDPDGAISYGVSAILATITPSFRDVAAPPLTLGNIFAKLLLGLITTLTIFILIVRLSALARYGYLVMREGTLQARVDMRRSRFWGTGGFLSALGFSSGGGGGGGFGGGGFSGGGGSFGGGGASGGW